jgi:hypothetical protein
MVDTPHANDKVPDVGLRRMMFWVLVALVATVLVAILAVELTLRWFGAR